MEITACTGSTRWSELVTNRIGLGLATFYIGLPLISHGTWHAYKDVVNASALPPRN